MAAARHRALPHGEESRTESAPIGPVHALFQQRLSADDALLRLAQLRFAQMGVAAELYADTPDELEHVLRFAPTEPRLPVVHLNRGIDLLQEQGRQAVRDFAGRFAGRISGLNVHDRRGMADLDASWLSAMAELDAFLDKEAPDVTLYLEYAAHLEPGRFTGMMDGLTDLALTGLGVADERLPGLVADVQDAVGGALGDVQEVIRAVGGLGKPVHFHLHDGHPLVPGLADHFSFLTRLAIPFSYEGRRSLRMLYGPAGLAALVSAAVRACRPGGVSFTLEVHQVQGRLPLGDAASLFPRAQDTTDAEQMNYLLNVLSENAVLISQDIAGLPALIRARLG